MALQAWVPVEEKLFAADSSGAVQEIAAANLQALQPEAVILFDYKKLLKKYPELSTVAPGKIFDVKLAAYVLDPADNFDSAKSCIEKLLPECSVDSYAAEAESLLKLGTLLREKLGDDRIYYTLELPLTPVLAAMEQNGIAIDKEQLSEFGKAIAGELAETEKTVFDLAGKNFNINSPKQLGELLFETLKLPVVGKKNKSGYSTDAETLEKLAGLHPAVPQILKYRKLSKVNSTYVEGLLKYIQSDGKVHTTFNMTATATGRLSSVEPNLQNIPVAGDLGGEIRKFIHPMPGKIFIDADYSQIELRILAHMADDPVMIDAFKNHQDIHTATACQIFGVAPETVTPEMRRKAKAVNFGIVYGISSFTLANDLAVTKAEAQEYINKYFEKYSAVKSYLDRSIEKAKTLGYAETLFGRKRFLPELKSKNFAVRSFGERVALNMPIQGTAADLIKMAMIKVHNALAEACPGAELLLQVHDELLISAPEQQAEKASELLRSTMENVFELKVPLEVSTAAGKTYFDVK